MFDFLTNRRKEATKLLTDCCLQGITATIMSPASGLVTSGRFQSLDENNVLIRFRDGASPLLSEPLTCVSFHFAGRPRVFFSTIIGVVEQEHRDVALALPEEISSAERRHSIRIPATPHCPVTVRITSELAEDPGEGTVVDLSLGGVLADFPFASVLSSMGSKVAIEITCPGESVTIPSRAARQDQKRCGFAFETPLDPTTNDKLIRILQRMENAWTSDRSARSGNRSALITLVSI
ncbi:MAG: PilZ domain-containing protein [Planctomycetota bacterium]